MEDGSSRALDVKEVDDVYGDINRSNLGKSKLTASLRETDISANMLGDSVLDRSVPRRNSDSSFIDVGKE